MMSPTRFPSSLLSHQDFHRVLVFALTCLCPLLQAEPEEDVELIINVLPGKGMKFNPEVLYREDQEVLQGVLGTSGNDDVRAMTLHPSGKILVTGVTGASHSLLSSLPRLGCTEPGKDAGAFLAITDKHFRTWEQVAFFPSTFSMIRHIQIADNGDIFLGGETHQGKGEHALAVMKISADLSTMVWRASARGDYMTGMVVLEDGSVVVSPNEVPFISRIQPDGKGLIPFGDHQHYRTDGKNRDIYEAWWLGHGFPDAGVKSVRYHRGSSAGVVATQDGHLVLLTTHFVRHTNGTPDFDPMMIKFTLDGELLWATHLLEGLPALSDHKSPCIYVCPYSGDIIAGMRQHGHFAVGNNLQVSDNAYLKTDNWLTGNIMIGWIGRIDPDDGSLKAGTMYFPDLGLAPDGGKRTANTLLPLVVRTDPEGHIYVAGVAAHRLATTIHAFQSEKLGSSGFISVFNPTLDRLLYANLVTGHGYGYKPTSMVITEWGPLLSSTLTPKPPPLKNRPQLITSNTDKNAGLSDAAAGGTDVLFSLLPSAPWKENW